MRTYDLFDQIHWSIFCLTNNQKLQFENQNAILYCSSQNCIQHFHNLFSKQDWNLKLISLVCLVELNGICQIYIHYDIDNLNLNLKNLLEESIIRLRSLAKRFLDCFNFGHFSFTHCLSNFLLEINCLKCLISKVKKLF